MDERTINHFFGRNDLRTILTMAIICLTLNLSFGQQMNNPPTSEDHVIMSKKTLPTPKMEEFKFNFNFVSSSPTDVAMIRMRLEIDRTQYDVVKIDFSQFQGVGAKAKKTVVKKGNMDEIEVLISFPSGHALPTSMDGIIEVEDIAIIPPVTPSDPIRILDADAMVVAGFNKYRWVTINY